MAGGIKRKRGASFLAGPGQVVVYKKTSSKRRKFTPGRDQTSGFYRMSASGTELKFHDITLNAPGLLTNWYHWSLNEIAQGEKEDERNGRKITIKSIEIQYTITKPSTTNPGLTDEGFTLELNLDKQSNGDTVTNADLWAVPSSYMSFPNLENSSRFRKLRRKEGVINSTSGANADNSGNHTYGSNILRGTLNKTGLNIPILFSGTTGSGNTIKSNNVYLWAAGSTGNLTLDARIRVRFVG